MFNFLNNYKKKNTCLKCKYVSESLFFDFKNNIRLCPYFDFGIIADNYDGIWLDTDKINSVRQNCINEINNNTLPSFCSNCHNLSCGKPEKLQPLKYLYLANWKYCYVNCSYCDFPKEEDLIKIKHYDIFPSIKQLLDSNIITKKTKVIFECGDAAVHPEFDKILFFFINYEMEDIIINTPALRYCESIAEAINKNIAKVIVSFDCACPYIYEKVKGINKYDIAMSNIKRYLEFEEPSQKRVILKYTLINSINNNQKELLDWFIMSKNLGIKKLAFDIDIKWYNQIKNSIPYYIKELIIFVKRMSDYNNIEIEFSDRIFNIYSSISKDEIKD